MCSSCTKTELKDGILTQEKEYLLNTENVKSSTLVSINKNKENFNDIDDSRFYIENGILVFPTFEDYQYLRDKLLNKGTGYAIEYLSNYSFRSLAAIYDDVYDTLNAIESENEDDYYNVIDANAAYFYIEEYPDGDKEVKTVTNDPFREFFANANFEYQIGDRIINLLRDFTTQNNSSSRMACGNPEQKVYTKNESGCKKDRRAVLKGIADYILNLGSDARGGAVENFFELKAQRKIICIWMNYKTEISYSGTPTMTSAFEDGTTFSPPIIGDFTSCEHCSKIVLGGVVELTRNREERMDIISATASGTTRGIGNNFVTIDCMD